MKKNDFIFKLEEVYPVLKKEFDLLSLEKNAVEWGEKSLYNFGWKTIGVRFKNVELEETQYLVPQLTAFVKSYSDLIETAGYSSMEGGTVIHPHYGYDKNLIRFHLGIDIPKGDCGLMVEDKIYRWENGKAFYFDDTKKHEAWNNTQKTRIVLLMDLKKKFLD